MNARQRLNPVSSQSISRQERFKRWHWGIPYQRDIEVDDDRFPNEMVEIGRLMELRFVLHPKDGKAPKDLKFDPQVKRIEVEEDQINQNFAVFDHAHAQERIYFVLSDEAKSELADYFSQAPQSEIELCELALIAGGHHADSVENGESDYPDIMVKPLGYLKHIVYFTYKKGDDPPSPYIHEFAEENRKRSAYPIVGVAEDGTLWVAGGGYTCPYAGITD